MERVDELLTRVGPLDLFAPERVPHDSLIERALVPVLPLACLTVDPAPAEHASFTDNQATAAQLIWGAPIVRRAAAIGVGRLPVHRIDPVSPRASLLLALRMEGRIGAYSWVEREAIHRHAVRNRVPIDDQLSQLVTGDGGFADGIARYLRLAPRWRRAVDEGAVDVRTAEVCGALPAAVLDAVTGAERVVSFSNRRLLLGWLSELCGRDGLHEPAAVELAHDIMRSSNPVEALRRLRYPRLTAMERRFGELQQRLSGGVPLALKAPRDFEGDGFELQIKVRSPDDIGHAIDALKRMQEHGDELFELL
ncbi:MAG: hypothetical protein EA384_14915 [Spirochaetaceae bacterium]|nr:MAG: hypothetical protein EA384_14915 [Spirochaetaceae bacterium]